MDYAKLKRSALRIIFFVGISQLAGIIGAYLTADAIATWYPTLIKPSFAPPNAVFGPVWIMLYTLMGISAALLYAEKDNKTDARYAMQLFWGQLLLNALWSPIFFGFKRPDIAFLIILTMDILVAGLIWLSYSVKRGASLLLVPYLAWLLLATALNYSIWMLN